MKIDELDPRLDPVAEGKLCLLSGQLLKVRAKSAGDLADVVANKIKMVSVVAGTRDNRAQCMERIAVAKEFYPPRL